MSWALLVLTCIYRFVAVDGQNITQPFVAGKYAPPPPFEHPTVGEMFRRYSEITGEDLDFFLQFDPTEFDPRHVIIDQHGRMLATHIKTSWSELESEMVCTVQPWQEAQTLPGWCPEDRYPPKYKPCPKCFIDNWCSQNKPWFGITCDAPPMKGRIIRLEFEGKQIGGEIYKNFPYFKKIQKIGLLSNDLSGNIPGNLGGCKALTHMSLDKNGLTGKVPGSLGGLKAITYLNVGNNQLSGAISGALGGMSAMVRLYFNDNQFSGQIPNSMGNMQHMSYLTFAHNQLSGQVPEGLCKLQKTVVIKVWHNEGLTCYPQCLARYSWFVRDNDPHKNGADQDGKVLCCCVGCSYVEVSPNERKYCPPLWPTMAPVHMPTFEDAAPTVYCPGPSCADPPGVPPPPKPARSANLGALGWADGWIAGAAQELFHAFG